MVFLDSQSTDKTLESPGVIELLQTVDVLLLNVSEALQISGTASRDEAGMRLVEFTPLVILKSGAEGAFAYTVNNRVHVPAIDVEVVDTTGSGDCFNAGFIAAYLRSEALETQLRFGNICGGLAAIKHGTVATPTLETAQRYLSEYR